MEVLRSSFRAWKSPNLIEAEAPRRRRLHAVCSLLAEVFIFVPLWFENIEGRSPAAVAVGEGGMTSVNYLLLSNPYRL